MVDALAEIHRLLAPDGTLIDIHAVPEALYCEVRRGDEVLFSEYSPDMSSGDECLHAQQALDEAVRRGLFALEQTTPFDFLVVASSVAELNAYLEVLYEFLKEREGDSGADAEATAEAEARVKQLEARLTEALREAGPGALVATRESAVMSRLRALG